MALNFLATRFTCSWPWSIAVMLCDGRIVCGCADPYAKRVLGDLRASTLADVWRAMHGDDPILGLHSANPNCTGGQRIQGALVEIGTAGSRTLTHTPPLTGSGELLFHAFQEGTELRASKRVAVTTGVPLPVVV